MKHYSTVYELEKDGVILSFKSEQEACDYLGVVKCSVASCYRRDCKCRGYTINRIGISTHHERYRLMYVQYQYNIKQADQLKIEAEKSDDLYHIACCTADIVGMLTGDEGYGKRIREKIGGIYE